MAKQKWNKEKTLKTGKKRCYKCTKIKNTSLFKKSKGRPDGLASICKACGALYDKSPKRKYSKYRHDALKRGIDFNISYVDFISFWKVPCHYCESEIETVGIDRVDNSIGYIKSNLVPCCWECNRIKGKYTSSELRRIRKIVDNFFKKFDAA